MGVDIAQSEQDIQGLKNFSAKAEQSKEVNQPNATPGEIDTGYITVQAKSRRAQAKQQDSDSDW